MATPRQIKAAKKISENLGKDKPEPMGKVLKAAGYADSTSETPKLVTESKGFNELMEEMLPDADVLEAHQQLLQSTRIEHMVFPLYTGIAEDDEGTVKEAEQFDTNKKLQHNATEGATLTDKDIEDMLAEVNCKVRKIVHGETARHVYFWSPDANARKNAIELAYKIKGRITNKVALEGSLRTSPFGDLTAEELRALANPKPVKAKGSRNAKK